MAGPLSADAGGLAEPLVPSLRFPDWQLVVLGWGARLLAWAAQRVRRVNPWLALLLPAFFLVTWGTLNGRLPRGHSFAPNLVWSHEWAEALRQGVWYPRWMEHTFAGLGSPTFHFYGPLSLAMVMPFSLLLGLSPSMSLLGSFWTALLLLGFGAARLVSTLCPTRARIVPALAGVLAMCSPYPLCDVYVRAALAETWGLAVFPWLLSSLFISLEREDSWPRVSLVLWTAAFALCHPPTLLLGSAALGAAIVFALLRRTTLGLLLRRVVLPMAIGLGLDAFYLLSALLDQRYVNVDFMTRTSDAHPINRLLLMNLSHLSLKGAEGFDGDILPGFVGCLVVAIWALCWLPRPEAGGSARLRARLSVLVTVAGIAALMMTDLSKGIYALIPIFDRVQFAWRWMAVLTVASVALWGYLAFVVTDRRHADRQRWRIPFFLFTCWLATQASSTILPIVDWNRVENERFDAAFARLSAAHHVADASATPFTDCQDLMCLNSKDELLFRDVSEYQPLTQTDHDLPPRTYAEVEWAEGNGTVSDLEWRAGWRRFVVDSAGGGRLLLRTTAWLGWAVDVSGPSSHRSVGDQAGDHGRMLVDVPAGKSVVTVSYRGTPNQRWGNAISLATLCLATVGVVLLRRRRSPRATVRPAQSALSL